MKKYIIAILTMVLGAFQMSAQTLNIGTIELPSGGQAKVDVNYETGGKMIVGYKFKVDLPEGLSLVTEDGSTKFELDANNKNFSTIISGSNFAAIPVNQTVQLKGESGTLGSFFISDDVEGGSELETEYTVTISNASLTNNQGTVESPDPVTIPVENFTFTVKIVENRVIFDEGATTLPYYEAGTGNVRMNRTIKAGDWSTIVLPFTLSMAKAKAVFGDDVQLAEYSGYETDYGDDEENVTPLGITVNFTTYTMTARKPMTGGKPFLIKTSKDIETFDADGVTLVASITDTSVGDNINGTAGKFTGSFVKTKVPADGLFISNNKFYYSTGATNIKAFRGWFELEAVFGKETNFGVKMQIDGIVTDIQDLQFVNTNGAVYTIDGKKMNSDVTKLPKGVYIINGKKVAIK